MKALVVVALVALGCKGESPPDRACAKLTGAYDAMAKTLMTLTTSSHAGSVALRCGALAVGIRGAPSLVPEALRPKLQPVFDALTRLAASCATVGHEATQQELARQLVALRETVVATCAK